MSAVFHEYHDWESAPAFKLLLPQRDEQFAMSDAARNNRIVKPTGRPYLSILHGSPSSQQPPSPAGRASSQLDPPAWDEVVTNYADRRGV